MYRFSAIADLVGCVPHLSSYYPTDKFWKRTILNKFLKRAIAV
ncbi:hypothetical protein [Oxynema aestuarii]|nr:hypothetical protein [Oxynema aestuarii]